MTKSAFSNGDIVVLKSGGPAMTVVASPGEVISEYNTKIREDYHCIWFKGASDQKGNFKEHVLVSYTPPSK